MAVANVLKHSFGKQAKQIECMAQKYSHKLMFCVKVLRKLPVKIYGQNPCITAVKNIIFS